MCEKSYSFTLKKFEGEGMNGSISVTMTPESVAVEDYNIGPDVEDFFGRDEHEYDVSVGVDGARAILKAYGIVPGPYPTEKLGLRLAERLAGNARAASKFKALAEAAGVKPDVWCR